MSRKSIGKNDKILLLQLSKKVPVTDYLDYRSWLIELYRLAKTNIPGYNYQKFSRDLKLGSSNAHLVISGSRDLTARTAPKIIQALGLIGVQKKYFTALIEYERATTTGEREAAFERALALRSSLLPSTKEKQQLEFFNDWWNAAILELLRLKEAQDDPEWIGKTLVPHVSVPKVKRSLELLSNLGYVVYSAKEGRLHPSHDLIKTGSQCRDLAIARFHQQMIDLGKQAITTFEPEEREVTSLTVQHNSENFQKLREEVRALKDRFIKSAESCDDPDQIVQINFQMFPLTSLK